MPETISIIVAAGSGSRMGGSLPKQFLPLMGQPVLWHSITAFQRALPAGRVIVVAPEDHLGLAGDICAQAPSPEKIQLIAGGEHRFESVRRGVAAIGSSAAIVPVHDGVRCLVSEGLIRRCVAEAAEFGSAVPVIPLQDSLREWKDGRYGVTDRARFRLMQTPQTFRADLLQKAFDLPYHSGFTDEAGVVEATGYSLHFVDGEAENLKITRPVDLLFAETMLRLRVTGSQEPGNA